MLYPIKPSLYKIIYVHTIVGILTMVPTTFIGLMLVMYYDNILSVSVALLGLGLASSLLLGVVLMEVYLDFRVTLGNHLRKRKWVLMRKANRKKYFIFKKPLFNNAKY